MQSLAVYVLCILYMDYSLRVTSCPAECRCVDDIVDCRPTSESNTLHHIPPGIPRNTRELRLHDQNINRIRRSDFENLDSLVVLEVLYSNVHTFDGDVTQSLPHLTHLSFQNNNISRVNRFAFRGMSRLQDLDLNDNPHLVIEPCSLSHVSNIIKLSLSDTSVSFNLSLWENCDDQSVPSIDTLEYLSIDGRNANIDFDLILAQKRLDQLDVAFPPGTFLREYNLSSLKVLSRMTLIGLTFFPREFLINDHLENVGFVYSSFITLPAYAFANTSALTVCAILRSELVYIHRDAFRGLSRLHTLQLYSNKLQTLPAGVFTDMTLAVLTLHDNPWNCNCLSWLSDVVRDRVIYNAVKCKTPSSLAGVHITSVDVTSTEPCDTIVTPPQSTPPSQSSPLPEPTSSEPGQSKPSEEPDENSSLLDHWYYLALGLAVALILLLAAILGVCWVKASTVSRGGTSPRITHEYAGNVTISSVPQYERQIHSQDVAKDAARMSAGSPHITHEYASDVGDVPQYERQIHSQYADQHVYAGIIEQDRRYMTVIE